MKHAVESITSSDKYSKIPKGPFYEFFVTVGPENFRSKIVIFPLMLIFFRYRKLSETLKRPLTHFFGTVEQNVLACHCDNPLSGLTKMSRPTWAALALSCSEVVFLLTIKLRKA